MTKRLFLKSVTAIMSVAFAGVLILEILTKTGPGRSVLPVSDTQKQNAAMDETKGASRDAAAQKNGSQIEVTGGHKTQQPEKRPVNSGERSGSGVATPNVVEGSDSSGSAPSEAEAEERMKHANPSLPGVPAGDIGDASPPSTEVLSQPISRQAPVKKTKRKSIH